MRRGARGAPPLLLRTRSTQPGVLLPLPEPLRAPISGLCSALAAATGQPRGVLALLLWAQRSGTGLWCLLSPGRCEQLRCVLPSGGLAGEEEDAAALLVHRLCSTRGGFT